MRIRAVSDGRLSTGASLKALPERLLINAHPRRLTFAALAGICSLLAPGNEARRIAGFAERVHARLPEGTAPEPRPGKDVIYWQLTQERTPTRIEMPAGRTAERSPAHLGAPK